MKRAPMKRAPMIGRKFGRLTVIRSVGVSPDAKGSHHKVQAKCDCGTVKVFFGYALRQARTLSCGCLRNECIAAVGRKNRKYFG
jgi:hypothetical protein